MRAAFSLSILILAGCGQSAPPATRAPLAATARASAPAVREFAQLPVSPGQPGGIAVDGDTVYVDTFGFVVRATDPTDNIYAFDLKTGVLRVDRTNPILIPRRFPVCSMGLSGMALDAAGRLYLVDMNSRIVKLDPRTGAATDYATFPTGLAGPVPTMPLDIAFDAAGNGYVSDIGGAPVIWRIPPGGGQAEIWFSDTRLAGVWSQGGGGLRIDPSGKWLYVGVVTSDENEARGTVYRLPLENPAAETVELFHQYANNVEAPPLGAGPLGIALGRSGKLYVALPGTSEVSILNPDGTEERRVLFDFTTQFVALTDRGTLLVTTWGFPSGPWPIYEAAVNDYPALIRPTLPD